MFAKQLLKVIRLLNSNVLAWQLAAGLAVGFLLGLIPSGNLIWPVLFLLAFSVRLHWGMAMLTMAIVKLVAIPFAGPLDALGWAVLNWEPLVPTFTRLYAMPVAPLTSFNHTLVAGGITAGLALCVPVFLAGLFLVRLYREKLHSRVVESRIYRAISRIPFVKAALSLGASSLGSSDGE